MNQVVLHSTDTQCKCLFRTHVQLRDPRVVWNQGCGVLAAGLGGELGGDGALGRLSVHVVAHAHAGDLRFHRCSDDNDSSAHSMQAGLNQQSSFNLQ